MVSSTPLIYSVIFPSKLPFHQHDWEDILILSLEIFLIVNIDYYNNNNIRNCTTYKGDVHIWGHNNFSKLLTFNIPITFTQKQRKVAKPTFSYSWLPPPKSVTLYVQSPTHLWSKIIPSNILGIWVSVFYLVGKYSARHNSKILLIIC